jgi:hypothetical protein
MSLPRSHWRLSMAIPPPSDGPRSRRGAAPVGPRNTRQGLVDDGGVQALEHMPTTQGRDETGGRGQPGVPQAPTPGSRL